MFRCLTCWKKQRSFVSAMQAADQHRRADDREAAAEKTAATKAAKKASTTKTTKKPVTTKAAKKTTTTKKATKKPATTKAAKKTSVVTKKVAKKPATTKKAAKKTTEYEYEVDQNVLARWPGAGFYPAHVFARHSGKYSVYFPEDAFVLTRVSAEELKKVPEPLPHWARMTRKRFYQLPFTHDDGHQYTVIKLGVGKNKNAYLCEREGSTKEQQYIDVGKVQNKCLADIFPLVGKQQKSFFSV